MSLDAGLSSWLSHESGIHGLNQFWKHGRRKFMAIFDPVERVWIAKDSRLPGVSVLAKTPSEAERHMAILKAATILGSVAPARYVARNQ